MSLLSAEELRLMRANSDSPDYGTNDPVPVVKLFTPGAGCTWLLTEIDPDNDRCFGLCDIGDGAELGYVMLSEITGVPGLLVEKDLYVKLDKPLSFYTEAARLAGRIVT